MTDTFFQNKKWWALIGVGIASFLGCMDFTIVNTALPAIQNSLHVGINELQWIINILILALSSSMVIAGRIADIYGRRKIFYLGMILFMISSLLAGCCNNMGWLIFWRFVQGIGCAVLYTVSGAIVSHVFPAEEHGKAMGIFMGIAFTGLAAGPVIGGLVVGALGWRWVFFINIPLAIVSLIICFRNVPEFKNSSTKSKVDYLGAVILMAGIAALIFAVTQGPSLGWASYQTILLLSFSGVMLCLLYFVEEKAEMPIVKFSLFLNRPFMASIVATFFQAFFYCLAFFLMPLYLHAVRGESAYEVGLMLLPTTAMVAFVSPIVGRVVDLKGPEKPILFGFVLFVLSAVLQAHFSVDTSLMEILIAFVLMGIAWGAVAGPSTILSMNSLPKSDGALAIGTSWTLHNIGGSIGLSLGISIYNLELAKHQNAFLFGYKGAMFLLLTSSSSALLILFWSFRKKKAREY